MELSRPPLFSLAEIDRVQAPFPRTVIATLTLLCCSSCGWPLASPPKRPLSHVAKLEVHSVTVHGPSGNISLDQPPVITAADVVSVSAVDQSGNMPSIAVELTRAGSAKMSAATTPATGQQVAFVVNGKVVGMPAIRTPISDNFVISTWPQASERDAVLDALTQ